MEDDAANCKGVDLTEKKWVLASPHKIVRNKKSE